MMLRVCCLMLLCSAALADLKVENVWARATAPGAQAAAVYGSFTNTGDRDIKLIGISTGIARMPMLHESRMEGDMMRMRHLDAVTIAPNKTVDFAPGGLHIMLTGLVRGLSEGDEFELTIELENDESVTVPVKVGKPGQMHAH